MKQFLALAALSALAALAGCASSGQAPFSAVSEFHYGAISHDPFWLVSIGDDRIVLTMGPAGGRADGELTSYDFPRVLPRTVSGVRRWESRNGPMTIAVEALPGPCTTGSRTYADRARVYLNGRVMTGCGGREVAAGRHG